MHTSLYFRHRPCSARVGLLAWALLALCACSSSGTLRNDGPSRTRLGPAAAGEPIALPAGDAYVEVRELEARRSLGDGRLVAILLGEGSPKLRARAARALGRLPYPEFAEQVTGPLCSALEDESALVRAEAAFALGVRADPGSAGVLLAYWRDPDPTVRERIIEAAARVHTPPIRTQVRRSMRDPELGVRRSAIRSTATWDTDTSDAAETDSALLGTLSPFPDTSGRRVEPDPEVVWNALYALSRRASETGRGAFLEHVDSSDARARIFAVRGLSRVEPTPEGTAALAAALVDPDWRVACEAAWGLGQSLDASVVPALLGAVDHASPHVRQYALEALRNFPGQAFEILPVAWRGTRDLSGSVRAAALGTLGRLLSGAEAAAMLEESANDRDPVVRAGAARAAAETMESFRAIPLLERLSHDPLPFVATAAIEGLGSHLTPRSRAILHQFLAHEDNGLRLSAILALAQDQNARAGDVAAVARAIASAEGDIGPEVAFNGLRVLGSIGTDEARSAVVRALDHEDRYVRRVAREVLAKDFGQPRSLEGRPRAGSSSDEAIEVIGREIPVRTRNPMVNVVTSKGTMTFELLAEEAPRHVESFVRLAKADHYDGLTFHRVVPNFVIQGGDYRGDGNGGAGPEGLSLGHEFTPRPYQRGALGMPRNENPDSGGAQIFVTHRPTPHLDGRYTLFGLLRAGGEVLDAIEVGDVIEDVLVTE